MEFYWIQIWQLFSYYVEIAAPLLFTPWFIAAMFSAPIYGIFWIILNIIFAGLLLHFMKTYQTSYDNVYSKKFLVYPFSTLLGDLLLIILAWFLAIQATSLNLLELAAFSDRSRPFYVQTLCFVTWGRICSVILLITTLSLDMAWFLYIKLFISIDYIIPTQEPQEDPQVILDSYFTKADHHTSDQCPICLENHDTTTLKSKSCGHEFHKKCLVDLLLHAYTCPMCIRRFRKDRYDVYHDSEVVIEVDDEGTLPGSPVVVKVTKIDV